MRIDIRGEVIDFLQELKAFKEEFEEKFKDAKDITDVEWDVNHVNFQYKGLDVDVEYYDEDSISISARSSDKKLAAKDSIWMSHSFKSYQWSGCDILKCLDKRRFHEEGPQRWHQAIFFNGEQIADEIPKIVWIDAPWKDL